MQRQIEIQIETDRQTLDGQKSTALNSDTIKTDRDRKTERQIDKLMQRIFRHRQTDRQTDIQTICKTNRHKTHQFTN